MSAPSHLRYQSSFEPFSAETTRSHSVSSPPSKKQKMSITQTYFIAASARSKLGKEACRADHDLRLLVGHANLLDSLMIELQDAERQQEAWFNQTMAKASKADQSRHIQWADTTAEHAEDDDADDDLHHDDSESDSDDDFDLVALPRRIAQPPVLISTVEMDEDDEDFYDDMEDDSELALTRVASQSHSPPELTYEEESDDESPPASPPNATLEFSEKEAILTTSFYATKQQQTHIMEDQPLFIDSAPLITSY